MTMNLRALHHAIALADEGNFARAAEKVHLTQSALSRSIQALERELDLTLFDRTGQGVIATTAGRHLLIRARRLLSEAGFIKREMELLRDGQVGNVSFGVAPDVAVLLPGVLARLTRRSPSLRANVEIANAPSLAAALRRESIDFFVSARIMAKLDEGFTLEPLGNRLLGGGFFVRRGHPLLEIKTALNLAMLKRYPVVSTRTPEPIRPAVRQAFQLTDSDPDPFTVVCDNTFLLTKLVLVSDSVLSTGRIMVSEELALGTLIELPLPSLVKVDQAAWAPVAAHLRGRTLSPAAQMVIDELRIEYAEEARRPKQFQRKQLKKVRA